jgi:hypothetical protein
MQPRRTVGEVLSSYPGPVELVPDVGRWRVILAFNLAFVAAGLVMMLQGQQFGLYVALAFGLLALPLAMVALPGAAKLTIMHEGFVATVFYRGHLTRWTDVSEFQVAQMARGGQFILVYDDASLVAGSHLMSGSRYAGRNSALPSTYGMSADELARILNHWRARALDADGKFKPAEAPPPHPPASTTA